MILAAKMSRTKIKLYFDETSDPTFCHVKGIQIES